MREELLAGSRPVGEAGKVRLVETPALAAPVAFGVFDKVVDCWVTTLEDENAVDFEVSNHYTSTHPASPFVNRIAMQARWPGGRATVRNRTFTLWQGERVASTHELSHRGMLREVVARHFGFDLPEIESLRVPEIPDWR